MHRRQRCHIHLIHLRFPVLTSASVRAVSACLSRMLGIHLLLQTRPFQTSSLTDPVFPWSQALSSVVLTTQVRGVRSSLIPITSMISDCVARWDTLAITSRRGTGKVVSVTPETKDSNCQLARLASPDCGQ